MTRLSQYNQYYLQGDGTAARTPPAPPILFLANMEGTFTTSTIDSYIPDIGEGAGWGFGNNFQINNGFFRIGTPSGVEQGHIWEYQELSDNYDVEYRMAPFINTSQGGQYLQFRSNNPNADSAIIFGLGNGNAVLWETSAGTGSISVPYSFIDNNATWYVIKLEVRNINDATMYIDREDGNGFELIGSTTLSGPIDTAHNYIGLRTWYTSGAPSNTAIYDYIKVTSI